MGHKALVLFSGGLDSLLAAKVLQAQGVDVEAVHLVLPFTRSATRSGLDKVIASAAQIGLKPYILRPGDDLAEIIAKPRFGYGKNLNPCQDCRIYQLRAAAALLPALGASYLATGEVVGQRPMSQRRDALFVTDREAGLKGLVLRPLSALCLPPTIPEERGWVDRARLLGLAGRGRTAQESMARAWNLSYPSPGGGCLLTYRESAHRYRSLLDILGFLPVEDIPLVGLGRHFRLNPPAAAVIGRNQGENLALARHFHRRPEGRRLLRVRGVPGPLTLLLGTLNAETLRTAAALTAHYADLPESAAPAEVKMLSVDGRHPVSETLFVNPLGESDIAAMRLG